jgi:hypothetical protein
MPVHVIGDDERASLTELEQDRVARVQAFMQREFGYISIQSTRPQTLAAGLVDSPAGQLAWIIDKFHAWTHPAEAPPETVIDRDSGVPTGAIMFAHDVGIRRYAEVENTIVRWTDVEDRGGHFAALEEPELLTADIRELFRQLR